MWFNKNIVRLKTQFFTITLTVSHRQYEWQRKIGIAKVKDQIYTQIITN